MSEEFFDLLYQDDDFCTALGRVMLISSKLESIIKDLLLKHNGSEENQRATFGLLIQKLKSNNLISRNAEWHFADLLAQRNYLTHNLYDLLIGNIEETLLVGKDLVPMDVLVYTEKAEQTANNLFHFTEIMKNKLEETELNLPLI